MDIVKNKKNNEKILIFVETKKKCNLLDMFLREQKINSTCIHGDMGQTNREKALDSFKYGKITTMLATDVAQRGLDLPDVSTVVNMDMPKQLEEYIHRIGRTGRIGQEGKAISLINENNKGIVCDL